MPKYCDCGNGIKVYIPGKGWTGAPDEDHDLCGKCWRSLRDSTRIIR
jgi:hypothetical protein